jgi:hypothetical protein
MGLEALAEPKASIILPWLVATQPAKDRADSRRFSGTINWSWNRQFEYPPCIFVKKLFPSHSRPLWNAREKWCRKAGFEM